MSNIVHDLNVTKPDYKGHSIVNLMRTLGDVCGAPRSWSPYQPLIGFDDRLAQARRIVLLVIDGLGLELLRAIGGNSVFAKYECGHMTSVYPPTTATAITTFMSGLAPQQHGLTGWFMHFRHVGTVTAVLPFVPRYGAGSLSGAGVDIRLVLDCPSIFDAIDRPSAALLPELICDSEFSRLLGGRSTRQPYTSLDDFAAQLMRHCKGQDDARFVYAYWSELDRLCHIHGPSSSTIASHLEALNAALTPVFEACADSGTVLIATADHGFIDSGANERIAMHDHPELANMLSLPLCGEPRSAYCYVRSKCSDAFEDYVASELADVAHLVPSEQLIDEGWFGVGKVHCELAARIGDYTLQMKDRYTIGDCVVGEHRHRMEGVHGGTAAAEMFVPLILVGP